MDGSYDLGIDVGTSFSASAIARGGQVEVLGLGAASDSIPTAIYLRKDGLVVIGDAANRRGLTDPARVARGFKRRLGDPQPIIIGGAPYSAQTLMAKMLVWVVEQATERNGRGPTRVAATHPANWGPYKLELFQQALQLADLDGTAVLSEPHAAAVAYASREYVADGAVIAVYDLGGGTFDAAVLQKNGEAFTLLGQSVGVEHLGGIDFDEAVVNHVVTHLGNEWPSEELEDPNLVQSLANLRRNCVEAKEALSSDESSTIPVLLPGVSVNVPISRGDFESAIRPRVEESIHCLRQAIKGSGVAIGDIDSVLLVGGSSRVPLVSQMVSAELGRPVVIDTDPKFPIAKGAALAAGPLGGSLHYPGTAAASAAPEVAIAPEATPDRTPAATTAAADAPTPTSEPEVPAPAAPAPARQVAATQVPSAPAPVSPTPASESPAPVKPNRTPVLAMVAAGVVSLLGAVLLFNALSGDSGDGGDGTVAQAPDGGTGDDDGEGFSMEGEGAAAPTSAAVILASADGMTLVPAATYTLGLDDTADHAPTRVEVLSADYFIDTTEVTNTDYAAFMAATGAPAPADWASNGAPAGEEDHPVDGVSLRAAASFCLALNKRLPTEAEWEIAARGPAGLLYPWGDEANAVSLPATGTYPVGSVPENISSVGVFDMAGNVWEWVSDPYDDVGEGNAVLRGGANGLLRDAAYRLVGQQDTATLVASAGFRCATGQTDPNAAPLSFENATGFELSATAETQQGSGPLGELLYIDDFTKPDSGWPEEETETKLTGYHPPDFYHLQASQQSRAVISTRGVSFADASVATDVQVDNTANPDGVFRYGLALRAGADGFVAFTVSPRSGLWSIVQATVADGSFAATELASGSAPSVKATSNDALRVDAEGSTFTFSVNGTILAYELPIPDAADRGDIGFYVETFDDQDKAHIHFDEITVRELLS